MTQGSPSKPRAPESLGAVVSEHGCPRVFLRTTLVGTTVLSLASVLMLLAAWDSHAGRTHLAPRLILSGMALLSLGLAGWVLGAGLRQQRARLLLCERGLVRQRGQRRQVLAWSEVASYEYVPAWGGQKPVMVLKLRAQDGSRWSFDSNRVENLAAIAAAVARGAHAQTVAPLRDRLASGATVEFGKIKLSPRGIERGRRVLPWTDAAGVFEYANRVWFLRHGLPQPAFGVPAAALRQRDVLLTLARERCTRHTATKPFSLSAHLGRGGLRGWLHGLWVLPVALAGGGLGATGLLHALDLVRKHGLSTAGDAWPLLGAALLAAGLGAYAVAAFAQGLRQQARRLRLARQLVSEGKLVRVLLLERKQNEQGALARYDYRYVTPNGVEARDSVAVLAGGAATVGDDDKHLLALASADEGRSILLTASGYPLNRLPRAEET